MTVKCFSIGIIFLLILTGCETSNTGSITRTSPHSSITVIQPSDAETPADLILSEDVISFTHKKGDTITLFFEPFTFQGETSSILSRIDYIPVTGSSTNIINSNLNATTGNPREDVTKRITAIMENTKYVQYTGIALMILGVVLVVFFKSPIQALFISALGAGMVILQSTLQSPLYAWVLVSGILLLPIFWLYHLYRTRQTLVKSSVGIQLFIKENPEQGELLKSYLSKKMDKSEKEYIKELKPEILKQVES